MAVDILIKKIEEYVNNKDGMESKRYSTILACLRDKDFMSLLLPREVEALTRLNNSFKTGARDLSWVKQYQHGSFEVLEGLYFKCLAYNNDKKKNISHFEDKTRALESRIKNANQNIEHINATAKLISGASVLSEYAQEFDSSAKRHATAARIWVYLLTGSILLFMVIVTLIFFVNVAEIPLVQDLLGEDAGPVHSGAVIIAIKAAIIISYLQVP